MRAIVMILFPLILAFGQHYDSANAHASGEWHPVKTAPHDGTVVEMMQTYGVAPWYGLFKWTKDSVAHDGKTGALVHFERSEPNWVSVDNPGTSIDESDCLFWRPYKSTGKYIDPTGGRQKSTAYWCEAIHRPYDKKADRCK